MSRQVFHHVIVRRKKTGRPGHIITHDADATSLQAAAGRTYRMETITGLTAGNWATAQSIGPLSIGQTMQPFMSAPPGATRLFFRVLAPQPIRSKTSG